MRAPTTQSRLVEQVYEAILSEITEGKLPPNSRLIQDELAEVYGVSRQPVQQALLLLRNKGVLVDAPGRGLIVAPLDLDYVQGAAKPLDIGDKRAIAISSSFGFGGHNAVLALEAA